MAAHAFRVAVVILALASAFAARAGGKCGDDPARKALGGPLYVTWLFPYPEGAQAGFQPASIFVDIDAQLGDPVPPNYVGPTSPAPSGVSDPEYFKTSDAAAKWEKRLLRLDMPQSGRDALKRYTDQQKVIGGVLVEHPPIPNPSGVSVCTCVLQRAVLLYEDGVEEIFVRTLFRTRKPNDPTAYAFLPDQAWWFRFESPTSIWFPLRLNSLQSEASWMVLDILSPSPKTFRSNVAWPKGFQTRMTTSVVVTIGNRPYNVFRLYREFAPNDPALVDFDLKPGDVLQ